MFTVYLPTKFCGRYFRGHTHTHTQFFLIVSAPKNLIISPLGNGDGRVVDKARILKAFYFNHIYIHITFFVYSQFFYIHYHLTKTQEDAEGSERSLPFYR